MNLISGTYYSLDNPVHNPPLPETEVYVRGRDSERDDQMLIPNLNALAGASRYGLTADFNFWSSPVKSPELQAADFFSIWKGHKGQLPPAVFCVLRSTSSTPRNLIIQWLGQYLRKFLVLSGVKPVVAMSTSHINALGKYARESGDDYTKAEWSNIMNHQIWLLCYSQAPILSAEILKYALWGLTESAFTFFGDKTDYERWLIDRALPAKTAWEDLMKTGDTPDTGTDTGAGGTTPPASSDEIESLKRRVTALETWASKNNFVKEV